VTSPPPVQYATSGEIDIAYQVLGEGPLDLIWAAGAMTHLGVMWEHPGYRRFCEQLASFSRLILFDKRGMGLSERVRVGTLEERMDDVRAVLDAAGSERAAVAGVSEGGPLSRGTRGQVLQCNTNGRCRCRLTFAGRRTESRLRGWTWEQSLRRTCCNARPDPVSPSNSAARCRSAIATRAGAISTRNPLLGRIGHPRRTTTPGSRLMVDILSPGTSGSRTCSATKRTMAGV
jgi:pimeloyl-ACP methyl ester carboxylesterase